MITSFACKVTEKLFSREKSRKIPESIQKSALRKLVMIHAAATINDLRVPPSNHLEKLKGNRKDRYSIRINKQWRISFVWKENNAHHVCIEDYHS